jgi:DNA-binding LacI/PurR family transcriptional regulator
MPTSKSSRPTMMDVANLSGVSYQTVSRVINNHPYVSKETRQRVQAAIDELGYRPSKAATKLASKSSKLIATVLYGSWLSGLAEIALNVELAAKTSGFDVILINITEPHRQLIDALENVQAWAVDGLMLIVPVQSLPFDEIQKICKHTPFVFVDTHRAENTPSVVIDEAYGTRQLVTHLIDQGHTQVGEISGPLDWLNAQVRHDACLQTFAVHDIAPPVHIEANWTVSGGYRAARRLLAEHPSLTAIIAANDSMALGTVRALYEAGLSVPQDVSVVGFDDIPEAAYFVPALTTVRRNLIQLGTAGFEFLIKRINDLDTPYRQQVLLPRVIFRDSTHHPR